MKIDLDIIPNTKAALIDTGPLRAMMDIHQRLRETGTLSQDVARRVKRVMNELARKLIAADGFNLRVLLKTQMLVTLDWRARVLDDLGGEAALTRWESRKEKADKTIMAPQIIPYKQDNGVTPPEPEPALRETVTIPGVKACEYKTTRCRTDADGLFRLAPIMPNIRKLHFCEAYKRELARAKREKARYDLPKPGKRSPKYSNTFHPIPLTPGELRGDDNKYVIRPAARPAKTGRLQSRDLSPVEDCERKMLSVPKSQRSTSAPFLQDPASPLRCMRDDSYVEGPD